MIGKNLERVGQVAPSLGSGGDGDLAAALDFLVGFNHVERGDGSGLGATFHLPEAILGHSDSSTLDLGEFDGGNPVPELRGGGKEEVLSGLGNFDIRPRICQFGPLQFGILRVHQEAF